MVVIKSIQLIYYGSGPTIMLHDIMDVCWFGDREEIFRRDDSGNGMVRLRFGVCLHGMNVK